jgi:hypothetical protein
MNFSSSKGVQADGVRPIVDAMRISARLAGVFGEPAGVIGLAGERNPPWLQGEFGRERGKLYNDAVILLK